MLTKYAKIIDFFILLIAVIGLSGAKVANAEVSYHLVRFPDISGAIDVTDSGVVLARNWTDGLSKTVLLQPVRDIFGNPVWDSNGDGIADGYTTITLQSGIYHETSVSSVNESLDVVGSGFDQNGDQVALLWLNAPEGNPPVKLGKTFDARMIHASSINDLKQIVVLEHDDNFSGDDPSNWWTIWMLSLVNPEDTDGDGSPDLWFKDDNGDGYNDLMINLAVKGPQFSGGCSNCSIGSINNFGEVAGMLSDSDSHGFIIVPEDIDSDGELEWFKDDDADGWNDLAQDLVPDIATLEISDSSEVVGTTAAWATDSFYYRWQIDSSREVNLVTMELGAYFMTGLNDTGQAVG